MVDGITVGMAVVDLNAAANVEGKNAGRKGTPVKSSIPYFISGDEGNGLTISFIQVAGSESISAMGLKTTISKIRKGDLVVVVYLKDGSKFFSPSLKNAESIIGHNMVNFGKILPAKIV